MQSIRKDIPTAVQLADPEDIFALVWKTRKEMSELGLSEKTVKHYTEDGLSVILKRHYDAGTDRYSDVILNRIIGERRFLYEQGQISRVPYQNLRKSAYWVREMHLTGDITQCKIPNWGQREPIETFQTLLDDFCANSSCAMAESTLKVARSAIRRFLFEMEDHGFNTLEGLSQVNVNKCVTGTLRAQMHSHQPLVLESNQKHAVVREDGKSPTLPASMGMGGGYVPMVYENHGIDSRYTGPHEVVPTISARCGTGGNNVPLVEGTPAVYCISGNTIDREPENGGNGLGCQADIAYTVTTCDRHAVYSRQRVDVFRENDVVSTESARQHKDATDLVVQPYQQTVGTLVRSDHKGISNQYVSDDKCIVDQINLIRRLTPLECERLQGFPDGWTNIPSASDSARYKALGNSVAIPCVEYVMGGIALVLRESRRRRGWSMIAVTFVIVLKGLGFDMKK